LHGERQGKEGFATETGVLARRSYLRKESGEVIATTSRQGYSEKREKERRIPSYYLQSENIVSLIPESFLLPDLGGSDSTMKGETIEKKEFTEKPNSQGRAWGLGST